MPGTTPQAARTGRIFDIKRFSSHDGPGIRSTVFLAGCPLRCAWCHNPEAFAIGNGPHENLREVTVPVLIRELERDLPYYDQSGGGVTLSGGEPLVQAGFAIDLLESCRKRELHTAIDTCGLVDGHALEQAARLADLVLYDIKHLDSASHRRWTGASNERILDNLTRLQPIDVDVWIRLPLIPGVNDSEEHICGIIRFLAPTRFRRVSILPYHRIAEGKYRTLGLPFRMAGTEPPPAPQVESIRRRFAAAGFDPHVGR